MTRSTPGASSPAKASPRSTISHLRRLAGPKAVERAIHADLAQAPEGHEHELGCRPASCGQTFVGGGPLGRRANQGDVSGFDRLYRVSPCAKANGRAASTPSNSPSRRRARRGRAQRLAQAPPPTQASASRIAAKPCPRAKAASASSKRAPTVRELAHGDRAVRSERLQMRRGIGRDRRGCEARLTPIPTATASRRPGGVQPSSSMPASFAPPATRSFGHLSLHARRRRDRPTARRSATPATKPICGASATVAGRDQQRAAVEIAGRRAPVAPMPAAPRRLLVGENPQAAGIAREGAPPRLLAGAVERVVALDAPALRREASRDGRAASIDQDAQNSDLAAAKAALVSGAGASASKITSAAASASTMRVAAPLARRTRLAGSSKYMILTMRR